MSRQEVFGVMPAVSLVILVVFLAYFHATSQGIREVAARLAGPDSPIERFIPEAREDFYQGVAASADRLRLRVLNADDNTLHERHKLRWLGKTLETQIYRAGYAIGGAKLSLYARALYFSLVLGLTSFFLILCVRHFRGALSDREMFLVAVAFSAFFLFASFGTIEEDFTPQETACIAAALYFALKRSGLWFTVAVVISILNRESGVAIGMLWPILNGLSVLGFVPFMAAIAVLLGLNYDLVSQTAFWSHETYVSAVEFERPGLFNFYRFPATQIVGAIAEILIVLSPLAVFVRWSQADEKDVRLAACVVLYLAVLMLGTYIGNIFPYLLLAPFVIVLAAKQRPLHEAT